MATQRIPLFGSFIYRNETSAYSTRDQQFINCYPEVITNPLKRSAKVNLYKRPGFGTTTNAAASYVGVSGRCVWTGFSGGAKALFCYLNGTDLRVYDTSGNIIGGTIANIGGSCRLTETKISGVAYLTLVAATTTPDTRNHAWFMAEGAGAWTLISDVDYPSNTPAIDTVGKMVHMNGRGFVMDVRGTIWQSAINDLTSWSAVEFIEAQESPDAGSGLEIIGSLVAAFGATTTEFFQYNSGATGSALTRISGSAKRIGAIPTGYQGSENIISVGDACYFMGVAADSGQLGVHRLSGTTIDKISTNSIDRRLAQLYVQYGLAIGIAGVLEMHGMQHIVLMSKGAGTYCYCIDTKQWWLFLSPGIIRACASVGGQAYFVTDSAGTPVGNEIWSISPGTESFQDSGTTLTMTIQTDNLDQGTSKRKFFQSAELVCDTQTTSGNISISWSDDDYATFSTARTIDPSTGSRRVMRLGSTKKSNNHKRAWKIEETINRPFRGTELVLEYDVGEA